MLRRIFSIVLVLVFMIAVSVFVYRGSHQPQKLTKTLSEHSKKESSTGSPQLPVKQQPFSKQELEVVIKEYILNHPEDIISSLEGMQKKKVQESAKQAQEYLMKNRSLIEQSDTPPVIGNINGDVSIVVFYDYACSFCKKANEYTNEIVKQDPGVKVILRPIAVLGDPSMYAAKVALAVQKISPIKFATIHNDLMAMRTINETAVKELMAIHDIDYSLLDNEINSYSVKQRLNRNFDFAKGLAIQGTPSYVINGEFIPGMLPVDKLQAVISKVRSAEPVSAPAAKEQEVKKEQTPKEELPQAEISKDVNSEIAK